MRGAVLVGSQVSKFKKLDKLHADIAVLADSIRNNKFVLLLK